MFFDDDFAVFFDVYDDFEVGAGFCDAFFSGGDVDFEDFFLVGELEGDDEEDEEEEDDVDHGG